MIRTGSVLNRLNVLRNSTSRDFKGGLDVADSQLNLSSRFARELDNIIVGIDGSLELRQGCRLFANLEALTDFNIVDEQYFLTKIVSIDEKGQVFTTDGQGASERIWDSSIAAALRPGLTIWGDTDFIKFEEFQSQLIAANGTDKPLCIRSDFAVDYLADAATGSNVNVPVSDIVTKHDRHLIWAIGSVIHVSERDAAGSYEGDPDVVYTGTFDLASYVLTGSTNIVGMISFKGFLMVMFQECIVPVQFVEVETPSPALKISVTPDSVISNYGTVSQRTIQSIGEQSLSLDIVGVASTSLTKFTKILSPDRPSRFVDPLIQMAVGRLDLDTLAKRTFAIYDRRLSTYMLFIPNMNWHLPSAMKGFNYRYIDSLDIAAWSTLSGWDWRCGTRSSEGRLFFTPFKSRRIYILGDSVSDPIVADFVGEQESFSDNTVFTDQTGFTPVSAIHGSGIPIKWSWELPWTDLKQRGLVKTLRYLGIDTEGNQEINCKVFVDNFYSVNDNGETFSDGTLFTDDLGFVRVVPIRTPALEWTIVAKDLGGYGIQPFGQSPHDPSPYGGGNNAGIEAQTLTPTKGKLLKLRFEGEAHGRLKFVAITLYYQIGTIRRMVNG